MSSRTLKARVFLRHACLHCHRKAHTTVNRSAVAPTPRRRKLSACRRGVASGSSCDSHVVIVHTKTTQGSHLDSSSKRPSAHRAHNSKAGPAGHGGRLGTQGYEVGVRNQPERWEARNGHHFQARSIECRPGPRSLFEYRPQRASSASVGVLRLPVK